ENLYPGCCGSQSRAPGACNRPQLRFGSGVVLKAICPRRRLQGVKFVENRMVQAPFSSILEDMKPFTRRLVYGFAVVLAGSTVQRVLAESKANPYQAIIERNPFGLKPPPPPPDPAPPPPAAPPAKVVLTGISSMFGVRALLEITEAEPGKSPTTRKPILKEG